MRQAVAARGGPAVPPLPPDVQAAVRAHLGQKGVQLQFTAAMRPQGAPAVAQRGPPQRGGPMGRMGQPPPQGRGGPFLRPPQMHMPGGGMGMGMHMHPGGPGPGMRPGPWDDRGPPDMFHPGERGHKRSRSGSPSGRKGGRRGSRSPRADQPPGLQVVGNPALPDLREMSYEDYVEAYAKARPGWLLPAVPRRAAPAPLATPPPPPAPLLACRCSCSCPYALTSAGCPGSCSCS